MNTEKTKFKVTESVSIPNSSNVTAVSYTDIGALVVQFKNGSEYLYKDVPKEVYEEMCKTESAGKYLNTAIKGKYEFEKVDEKKGAELRVIKALDALMVDDTAVSRETKPKKDSGEAVFTRFEILAAEQHSEENSIVLLQMLKEKGAPILGAFFLEQDPNYNWTQSISETDESVTYKWSKK
jgi:hypothetical protein